MAAGDPASSNRIAWQYHSDDGNTYRVAAVKMLTDQGLLGGEAWAGTVTAKPASIKMRRITVSSVTYGARVVPVYSTDADILTPETAILVNVAGIQRSLASSGNPIPEGHVRRTVTKQAA